MRRLVIGVLLAAALLTGCGKKQETTTTPPVQGTHGEEYWVTSCAEVYKTITEDLVFRVSVEEKGGKVTDLAITPDNAWNVEGRERLFSINYVWSEATQAEWDAQLSGGGNLLTISEETGDAAIWCRSDGNVVCWRADGSAVQYARVMNPKEGEPFEGKLYHFLDMIAEDAVSANVWNVTADGELDADEAAEDLLDQITANFCAVPDWVTWKPVDAVADGANVYDHYWGEGENFCCGMGFLVKLADPEGENGSYWNAGAGLETPDEDGYYSWGRAVHVKRNENGDWYIYDKGTGGYLADLPFAWEDATLEMLVEAFFESEGDTHEWEIPYYILALPREQLRTLPELLEDLAEEEALELIGLLEKQAVNAKETGPWVADMLKDVLEEYNTDLAE